jgi:Ni/Fe-hydrogenase 1 B-type cytochrome subunit
MPAGERAPAVKSDESEATMTTAVEPVHHPLEPEERECLHVVYVWEWPVRIAHWVIFLSILVLSFTGYYMYDPFIISRGNGVFLMATMRFIHEVTAFVFTAAVLLRFYWFFKGNKWARWKQFLLVGKERRKDFVRTLKYYLFLRRKPLPQIGHNPLAGLTYALIYFLMLVQIITGLALYDYASGIGHGALGFFAGWLSLHINVQHVREAHFLIMFGFLAFVIHHVYSAVLFGVEHRTSGIVGSIFAGYKFSTEEQLQDDLLRNPDGHEVPGRL